MRFLLQEPHAPAEHQRTQAYLDGWVLDRMPAELIAGGACATACAATAPLPSQPPCVSRYYDLFSIKRS